jgi:hypothetical protein
VPEDNSQANKNDENYFKNTNLLSEFTRMSSEEKYALTCD